MRCMFLRIPHIHRHRFPLHFRWRSLLFTRSLQSLHILRTEFLPIMVLFNQCNHVIFLASVRLPAYVSHQPRFPHPLSYLGRNGRLRPYLDRLFELRYLRHSLFPHRLQRLAVASTGRAHRPGHLCWYTDRVLCEDSVCLWVVGEPRLYLFSRVTGGDGGGVGGGVGRRGTKALPWGRTAWGGGGT